MDVFGAGPCWLCTDATGINSMHAATITVRLNLCTFAPSKWVYVFSDTAHSTECGMTWIPTKAVHGAVCIVGVNSQ
jgi:hypothetical protein